MHDFRAFAKKRIKGIYFPFVKFALLFLLLHNVFFYLNIYNGTYGYNGGVSCLYNWHDIIKRVIKITTTMTYEEQLLGGYWFLRILFCTSFMGYAFLKFLTTKRAQIIGLIVLFLIVISFCIPDSLSTFWQTIYMSCLATIFFIVGKKLSIYDHSQKVWYTLVCFVGVLILSWINPVGMTIRESWSVTLYIIGAIFGTLMTKNVSFYIQQIPRLSKVLTYIGNNTLTILTWHFLSFKLISLLIIKIYNLPIETLAYFPVIPEYAQQGWWVAYVLVGLLMSLCMNLLLQTIGNRVQASFKRNQ